MDDIYVYCVPLPPGIHEMIVPCCDGYTVYIDEELDAEHRQEAYDHALSHALENDFEKENVQEIESLRHYKGGM